MAAGTDANTLLAKLGVPQGASAAVYHADGRTKQTGIVGTGNIVIVTAGTVTKQYSVVVYGDVNGDGKITALDLLKVQKHLVKSSKLKGYFLQAANVKRSGSDVSALDLLKIQKHIIGAAKITQ